MGYYVHSCPKMRYKAAFHPSYLSCPVTHAWVSVEKCQRLLNRAKFTRFASEDETSPVAPDVNAISLVLPMLPALISALPPGAYTIEGKTMITTVGAVRGLLSQKLFDVFEDWARNLVAAGTMRIKLA